MPRKKVMTTEVMMIAAATMTTAMKNMTITEATAVTPLTVIEVIHLMDTLHTVKEAMDTALLMATQLRESGYRDAPKEFGYRLSTNMFADHAEL